MRHHTKILIQQNRQRTERYIHLKHLIDTCKTPQEIEGMGFLVHDYAVYHPEDGKDLINHLKSKKI